MKTLNSSKRQSAIALVIVLAMLVLLSGLIVAFMSTVTNERNSTAAASAGATARQIADNTVNLVIAQIREATTRYTDTAAWASQPGAIRVFSGRAGSRVTTDSGGYQLGYDPGSNDWVYKLYSSDHLKVKSQDYTRESQELKPELDVIENWTTQPDKDYVDMNEPILVPRPDKSSAGTPVVEPRYPIIDPRAAFNENGSPGNSNEYGIVKGFSAKYSNLPGSTRMDGNENVPILPMPVQWMYVLQDGSMLGPEAINSMGDKLENNPIVGRTAFWTDDESCKVNINTASEGVFWDTPTSSVEQESGQVQSNGTITSRPDSYSLGCAQPSRGEIQRYGGHPATTSLSPILGWRWDLREPYPRWKDPKLQAFEQDIYQMAPFLPYGAGTSLGGTENPDPDRPDRKGAKIDPKTTEPLLKVGTKRLYANPDEYIFQSERHNGSSEALLNGDGKLHPEDLEKVRFFLTANSRSPEVNLFNRPRITFWPVSDIFGSNTSATQRQRTNFDNLFAFASTIGGERFYFSRDEAKSATRDISLDQNVKILRYLQWLTGDGPSQIPGFGGNFKEKLQGVGERDELLALIFDYVRCVNLVDTGTTRLAVQGNKYIPYTPFFGEGQAGYGGTAERSFDWSGQVTPSVSNGFPLKKDSKGLGRFVAISEAALIFTRAGAVDQVEKKQKQVQAVLAMEMTTAMPGFPGIRETFWTLLKPINGGPKFAIGDQQADIIPPPDKGEGWVNIINASSHEVGFGRAYLPTLSYNNQMHFYPENKASTNPALYPDDPARNNSAALTAKNFSRNAANEGRAAYVRNRTLAFYPYISDPMDISATAKDMKLLEGEFQVEIYSGESPEDQRSTLVQTVTLKFPSATLPLPVGQGTTRAEFGLRFGPDKPTKDNHQDPIKATDVIRSIEYVGTDDKGKPLILPQQGDIRVGATKVFLPAEAYQPRDPNRWKTLTPLVHGLQTGHADPATGYSESTGRGTLSLNVKHRDSKPPMIPAGIKGVQTADGGWGDWDRGLSKHLDGAFGGKVDEGNVNFEYNQGTASYRVPYFLGRGIAETGQSFFTPNRQLPSAVMFGSLPTGAFRNRPWQTLLFRPDRTTSKAHPGAATPEDHLLLDLFNLPIVEPYAISEPFSSAGKINLNYIMAPFGYAKGTGSMPKTSVPNSYIRRDTGLRAVLKASKIGAVSSRSQQGGHNETSNGQTERTRYDIDLDQTIAQVEDHLQDPKRGLFRSATEICDVDLYPDGPNISNFGTFWDAQMGLTGDNMRERPYALIYPRLTTKSNTFTVHMRCQTIRQGKRKPGKSYEFDPDKDEIVGEYRGSAIVERFIDPNDPDLKNYDYKTTSVDPYYRFRILATKQFSPQ